MYRRFLLTPSALCGFLLVLALGCPEARAQINTEKMRAKEDLKGLSAVFDGAVTWQTGTTELLLATMAARLEYARGVHRPFLQGTYSMGSKSDVKFVHLGFLHARWPAMWHPRVGTEVFSQIEFNEFRLQKLRSLVGAGVRAMILRKKTVEMYVGSGYMFEVEHLDLKPLELHPMGGFAAPRHPSETYHHRWTNYVSVRVDVKKWITVTNVLYAQPRFDRFKDVRVLEDLSVAFKVSTRLAVVLAFELYFDSDPPMEIKGLDTRMQVRLQVKL